MSNIDTMALQSTEVAVMDQPVPKLMQENQELRDSLKLLQKRLERLEGKLGGDKSTTESPNGGKNDERKVARWLSGWQGPGSQPKPATTPMRQTPMTSEVRGQTPPSSKVSRSSQASQESLPNDLDGIEQYIEQYGSSKLRDLMPIRRHASQSSETIVERDSEGSPDDMESLSNRSSMTYVKSESIKCEDKLIECLNKFEKNIIELSQRLSLQNQEVTENSVDAALNQPELYLPIQLITEDSFKFYHGFDVTSADLRQTDSILPKPMVALRTKKIGEFAVEVARQLGIRSGYVRLWAMVNRQNKTVRPEEPLDEPEMTIEEAYVKFTNEDSQFHLYAEIRDSEPMDVGGWNTSALVFLKCFDVSKQTLTGVCHTYVHMQSRIADLGRTISEKMDWPVGTEVLLFEEVKHNLVQPMKPKQTFGDAEIQNGDIICFQRQLPEEKLVGVHCTDARQYYSYLFNQRDIRFVPLKSGKMFTLTLNGKMSYEQWSAKVGEHLKVDPTRLRFAPISQQSGQPKNYVKRTTSRNLSYVLRGTSSFFEHDNRREDRLFYEILEESLSEYETKKLLKISWLPGGIVNEQPMDLLVPDDGVVKDVIEALRKRLGVPKNTDIRMMEVYDDKIYRSLAENIEIRKIGEKSLLYAEPTPLEESNIKDDEFTIHAFSFDKELKRTHGVPFKFVLKAGEKVADMKQRLSERTNLRDEVFDKIKISVVPDSPAVPIYVNDEDIFSDFISRFDGCMLGLDYMENFSIIL